MRYKATKSECLTTNAIQAKERVLNGEHGLRISYVGFWGMVMKLLEVQKVKENLYSNPWYRMLCAYVTCKLRAAYAYKLIGRGVVIPDPYHVYIDPRAWVASGSTIMPGAIIKGESRVGRGAVVGPNCVIDDTVLREDAELKASTHCENAVIGKRSQAGPMSHLRPGTTLGTDVYIGNYVEINRSTVGKGTKIGHHCYIGDAVVGMNVNIGAGTITSNYDGRDKFKTVIGDGAFIGVNTQIKAPVTIGQRAFTAMGAMVFKDVPDDALYILYRGVPEIRLGESERLLSKEPKE